ncbi:unnamed protein product [Durusdinium trenchii]|uniref:Uncharacterized protein n=1 Tax=Durusdinium trenchii TaxID=1381693 RepID=A0ABP0LR78_9DINO
MAELAQVCLACARVKYFDSQSFADIIAAVKVHLRSYIQLKADDVGGVLSGLADVNAYDKELFELAASALNRTAGHLQRPARKVILDAFKKVKHRSENSSLREMSEQEAKARYEERCSEDAPLDLGTEAFYPSRSTAIEARASLGLGELAAMSAGVDADCGDAVCGDGDVAADVRQNFRRLQGWRIRGVRWDRYDATGMCRQKIDISLLLLVRWVAGPWRRHCGFCVKTTTLQGYQIYCHWDFTTGWAWAESLTERQTSRPRDWLTLRRRLWSWQSTSPRARFVEVKSERDTLARRRLRDCHRDILIRASSACESHSMWLSSADRFEQEVFQNKIRQRRKRAASEGSSEGF